MQNNLDIYSKGCNFKCEVRGKIFTILHVHIILIKRHHSENYIKEFVKYSSCESVIKN